jgi:hypothetical protein
LHKRLVDPCLPIVSQNQQFPDENSLSFERHLIGVHFNTKSWLFNFIFSDGTASLLTTGNWDMKEVKIKASGIVVKRVVVWYRESDACLAGF